MDGSEESGLVTQFHDYLVRRSDPAAVMSEPCSPARKSGPHLWPMVAVGHRLSADIDTHISQRMGT